MHFSRRKILLPLIIIYILLNSIIFFSNTLWAKFNADKTILLLANLIFFILGITVFFMQQKALKNSNPNVFIRSIIGGTMLKMFATVIAVVAYVVIVGNNYSKSTVFISLFMYLIYLAAEVVAISQANKNA
jgi:hypothetical protein